jgi:two-component system cell cycle sensor histidine kinase/response regulator CckA
VGLDFRRLADSEEDPTTLRARMRELERELAHWRDLGTAATAPTAAWRAMLVEAERAVELGTWTWNLTTNRVAWSPGLFRILGYEAEDFEPTTEAFFAALHPEDRERVAEASRRGVATGSSVPVAFRVLRGNGEIREVLMDGVAQRDASGRHVGFVGTVLDLTERRAVERALERERLMLEESQRHARVGTWTLSLDTGRLSWSPELYRILGVEPGIEPDADRFHALIHPDDRERVIATAERVARTGVPEPHEFRILRPGDGSERVLRVQAHAVTASTGERFFLGTTLDVTERVALEAALSQASKMDALGQMAGGMAHNFNNLLTVIRGYAELLERRRPEPELRHILDSSDVAARLLDRLLQFSRSSPLEPRRCDLNTLVGQAAEILRGSLGPQVEIVLDLDPEVGAAWLDPAQFESVLLNLGLNARDAMPLGGRLTLRTRAAGNDASRLRLEVADTGEGMDEATRQRIFEPFFTTKPPGRGTGLGLATVFGFVRQVGGDIQVQSAPGQGALFRLELPAAPPAEDLP